MNANSSSSLFDRAVTAMALGTVVLLGLSAGAMLTEAALLVSWWRSLEASEFLAWFAANEPRLVDFYGPLQTVAAVATLATTALFGLRRRRGTGLLAASTALSVAAIATYFVYFQAANASFVAASIAPADVAAELSRWGCWQWVRTAIGTSAFVTALLALRSD